MPCITYRDFNFRKATLEVIKQADAICSDFAARGFNLTLRQLYYQFVARGLIPNRDTEYDKLGSIINDARLAGLLDWDYIEDRTRKLEKNSHWTSPRDIIRACAIQYQEDRWLNQSYRLEVWVEKDALVDVIGQAAQPLDVDYFSCRGYTSQSEVWTAGQRLAAYLDKGKTPVVIHLGDHDPSGIDMTRDITDRLELFVGESVEVRRIALNMDQVIQYNPPPNPAKLTDSRGAGYVAEYGDDSWELDALDPQVLVNLIQDTIRQYIDQDRWDEDEAAEKQNKAYLEVAAGRWSRLTGYMETLDPSLLANKP